MRGFFSPLSQHLLWINPSIWMESSPLAATRGRCRWRGLQKDGRDQAREQGISRAAEVGSCANPAGRAEKKANTFYNKKAVGRQGGIKSEGQKFKGRIRQDTNQMSYLFKLQRQ